MSYKNIYICFSFYHRLFLKEQYVGKAQIHVIFQNIAVEYLSFVHQMWKPLTYSHVVIRPPIALGENAKSQTDIVWSYLENVIAVCFFWGLFLNCTSKVSNPPCKSQWKAFFIQIQIWK